MSIWSKVQLFKETLLWNFTEQYSTAVMLLYLGTTTKLLHSTVKYCNVMNPYSICYSAVAPCQEYDRLKADPDIKHPEKYMLNTSRRQGQYQGCFSKSHWGGKRISQQWDLFCEIAPKQAKMYSELPNHVRALLGIEERKHNNSKFKATEGTHRVPTALIVALESLLMERIHLGEEVTYDLAASVLLRLVGLWNEKAAGAYC